MAAGGYKEFVAGETLDQDEINDYLMQGMLVFAGTAARGSAITSPVEGQFSYLADTDAVEFYDGSAWVEFSPEPPEFNYVVVAGGGGGGAGQNLTGSRGGSGGGAGGYRCSVSGENTGGGVSAETPLLLLAGTYNVSVGAGGSGGASEQANGTQGTDSFFANVRSYGGGKGAGSNRAGFLGGSGSGGGANVSTVGSGLGAQGRAGGAGASEAAGGGGGGAVAGSAATTGSGGNGGNGVSSSITGSSVPRAGGGGGSGNTTLGTGGTGGGGNGSDATTAATGGTANTGGGGGGSRPFVGGVFSSAGNGGSGVVIIKYPDNITLTIGAGLTSSTSSSGGFKVTTFTAGTDTVTIP